jgi:hypothetical protein
MRALVLGKSVSINIVASIEQNIHNPRMTYTIFGLQEMLRALINIRRMRLK